MCEYFVEDTIQFFDAIAKIKSGKNEEAYPITYGSGICPAVANKSAQKTIVLS